MPTITAASLGPSLGGSAPASSPSSGGAATSGAAGSAASGGAANAQTVQTGLYNTQQSTASTNLTAGPAANGNNSVGNTAVSQTSQGNITNIAPSAAALAALSAGTQTALNNSTAQLQSGFALAGTLATNALNDASAALTPADQRVYTTIEWVVGLAVLGLVSWLYLRRA